jgi:monoamine oxidase
MNKEKVLIIGAGISGLATAALLQEKYDVTLIEARETVGGRVMDVGGHDLGP